MISPKFDLPDRLVGAAMVEQVLNSHTGDSRLNKVVARIGWKLGYTPEWRLDNPKDAILADAANILVESE